MPYRLKRPRLLAAFLALISLVAGTACAPRDNGSTDPGGDSVIVTASSGTIPIYTWSGPSAVSINVARASAPSVAVWGVSSPINRNIASGAQQGVVPAGATETATTERVLTAGVEYRVTVALIDGTSGSVDFTP